MSIVGIIVLVIVALAVLAYLFMSKGQGPLHSAERATDQRNRVSAFGKPRRFQEDLERPREEGGNPRGV
jgi:hypothetical protein